jgi:regulator of sirC expression with transglutaminase-like and TPR domain
MYPEKLCTHRKVKMFFIRVLSLVLILFFGLSSISFAQTQSDSLLPLRKMLELPENKIDLIKAKLLIDQMIDPKTDVVAIRKVLNAMAINIKALLPPNASNQNKLIGLRRYVYLAGEWNNFKPFSYDLDDPFGDNIQNKLIATYLSSKKGNCVSMPILVLLLGQKLGLDMSLSTAPNHLFLKFRDDTGKTVNLEGTNQAAPVDDSLYQKQYPMTDLAIKSGIYMQSLNKKETVSVMMGTLMEAYAQANELKKIIDVADLALKHYPQNVTAILFKGTAYALMIQQEYEQKYPMPSMIPAALVPRFLELSQNRDYWYDQAEALGFAQPDQASEDQYKLRIQQEKNFQHKDEKNAIQ